MGKLWKFLAVSIVIAVCLGLMMVPGAPLSNKVALAAGNVTIAVVPSTTTVVPNGTFNVSVVIDNPDAMDIFGCQARLDFNSSYFNVTGITNGPIMTEIADSSFDNVNGTADHAANMVVPPAANSTNATSIVVCNISCQALAKEGMSTIDFVYQSSPPFRKTMVTYGPTDYLESGNMSLMHSGTVRVGSPTLTVNVTPALKGNVTIDAVTPPSYPNTTTRSWDEVVNLTAVVSVPNWTFTNWSGDLTGSANPTNITMDDNKNVTANFAPNRTLTMAVDGNGTTVPAVGNHTYGEGMVVNISADPDSGWQFVNWTTTNMSEITNSTAQSTTVTVDENKTVTATFAEVITATLEGHVSFAGVPQGPEWERRFNVSFFNSTTQNETLWSPMNATTNNTGVFTIPGIDLGTYNISIKNSTCLSKLEPNVTLTAGNTTVVDFGTTREGDCNGDDWVTLEDRSLLYAGWDTTNVIQAGHYCDLNRDGWLTLEDRSLMYANWDQGGD